MNRYLLRTAVTASVGGLLFGFDTAVIAGTTRSLTDLFRLTPGALGVTVSSALWGTVVGAAFSGALSDRIGRRRCLQWLAVLYFFSAFGCVFAFNWPSLLVFRIMSGLAIGGSSVVSPTYIAEIAPSHLRGRLVAMFQFNVVLGILLAYLSNYWIGLFGFGASEWRWKFGVATIPALLFLLSLFRIPESPRWLVSIGRPEEAATILSLMGESDSFEEVIRMQQTLRIQSSSAKERIFQWSYRLPIFLAVTIGFFNQISGINAILYYLNSIFEAAGFDRISSDVQSVMIGVTNLIAVSIAMAFIDRIGRRLLLLIGAVGTATCLGGVGYIFLVQRYQPALVWLLVGFIAFFSFSQGAVIWVYISEVFPNRVRAKGQSLGSFTHWFMNAAISAAFPLVAARWHAAPFFFFASMMALQFFVVLFFYPETRGMDLEAMDSLHAGG